MMAGALTPVEVDGTQFLVKDEASAPSRSHKQRAADAMVTAVLADGFERVVVGSCGNYGIAVAASGQAAGAEVTVVVPSDAGDAASRVRGFGADVVTVDGSYEDAVDASRVVAVGIKAADGNVDGPYEQVIQRALGAIASEVLNALAGPLATLWVPLGNGTTVLAITSALRRAQVDAQVVGVTTEGHNSILASWPGRYHRPLAADAVRSTSDRGPLVNWSALHGQRAIDALHATGGSVVGVSDHQLMTAAAHLRARGTEVTPSGAAGVAGLLSHPDEASPRTNVAVLTGR